MTPIVHRLWGHWVLEIPASARYEAEQDLTTPRERVLTQLVLERDLLARVQRLDAEVAALRDAWQAAL